MNWSQFESKAFTPVEGGVPTCTLLTSNESSHSIFINSIIKRLFFTFQLREFDTLQQDTGRWLLDRQQQLDSLGSQAKAEDRLRIAQVS